jgi:hypothetical protein
MSPREGGVGSSQQHSQVQSSDQVTFDLQDEALALEAIGHG